MIVVNWETRTPPFVACFMVDWVYESQTLFKTTCQHSPGSPVMITTCKLLKCFLTALWKKVWKPPTALGKGTITHNRCARPDFFDRLTFVWCNFTYTFQYVSGMCRWYTNGVLFNFFNGLIYHIWFTKCKLMINKSGSVDKWTDNSGVLKVFVVVVVVVIFKMRDNRHDYHNISKVR